MFRQGFVPPPLPGLDDPEPAAAEAAAERAFADDSAAAADRAAKEDSDAEAEDTAHVRRGERANADEEEEEGEEEEEEDGDDLRNPVNMVD